MLRLALEPAQANESSQNNRPRRSEPAKTILAWLTGLGKYNAKNDYAQSQTFERVTHLKDGAGHTHHQALPTEEPVLNDLNVAQFFSHLRIRLPTWRPKTLEEEMALLAKQRAAAKKR